MGKLLQKNDRIEEAKDYLETAVSFFRGLGNENLLAGLVEKSL